MSVRPKGNMEPQMDTQSNDRYSESYPASLFNTAHPRTKFVSYLQKVLLTYVITAGDIAQKNLPGIFNYSTSY